MTTVIDRLLDLHSPYQIFDACEHQHTVEESLAPGSNVVDVPDLGFTCNLLYSICRECCMRPDGEYQSEDCVDGHDHGLNKPICKTAVIFDCPELAHVKCCDNGNFGHDHDCQKSNTEPSEVEKGLNNA